MRLDKGQVKYFQSRLNAILLCNMAVDGDYGPLTKHWVKTFQKRTGLAQDGVIGPKTAEKINEIYTTIIIPSNKPLKFDKSRFVVFVDAGHGSTDDNGRYVTRGKKAKHQGLELHRGPDYYEGFENRLIAEAFIERLLSEGIMCVRLYHPYKDTPLSERTDIVRSYLNRGYYGYLHSFHSNAISLNNSEKKLEDTVGFSVWTTLKNNLSDEIATKHFGHVKEVIGFANWRYMTQKYKDGDVDFEANFKILRETDLQKFPFFGAILEEFGFHTSSRDCKFIINPKTRINRVKASAKTAIWTRDKMTKLFLAA